ncbi:hypothetical protein sS8_3397 [Methylocaldum marinum]|uniref:Uncharacterized protein n=1 Tax=Methylocaldum marinum TaxID=1432792 RepID=A0A250KUM5_9GAMM|nr:hypothetical protein sS8_3397 [Methylocaldum marinum]
MPRYGFPDMNLDPEIPPQGGHELVDGGNGSIRSGSVRNQPIRRHYPQPGRDFIDADTDTAETPPQGTAQIEKAHMQTCGSNDVDTKLMVS